MTVERHLGQFLKNSGFTLPGCEPAQSQSPTEAFWHSFNSWERWHSFFYAGNTEKEPRRAGGWWCSSRNYVFHAGKLIQNIPSFLSLIHLLRWIDNIYQKHDSKITSGTTEEYFDWNWYFLKVSSWEIHIESWMKCGGSGAGLFLLGVITNYKWEISFSPPPLLLSPTPPS